MAEKLKASVINLFCIGEMGFSIMMAVAVNYYAYFLTDVARIGAATVGTILLIARIADAVSVPIVGGLIEKSNMKWGKYRSWILICPFSTAILFILMFTNLNMTVGAKAIFLGTAYVLAHVSVNFAWSAYVALIPVLANDPVDRVRLSSRRAQTTSIAQIIFGLIAMPLIIALGAGNEAKGFLLTIIIFTILQVLGYRLVAHIIKPFDAGPRPESKKETITLKDMLIQVFTNPPLLVLMLVESLRFTSRWALLGFAVYYFKYVARNMLLVSAFFPIVNIAGLLGAIFGELIARKIPKKTTYIIGVATETICLLLAWLFARDAITFIVLCAIATFGVYIDQSIQAALFADTVEYAEWKTGKNARALIMAMSALPIKIGVALAGAVNGFALAAIGYVANVQPTAELSRGISTIATFVPGIFGALALVTVLFYPLKEERVNQIRIEIQARRSPTF
ncbi:Isoprimeverose transporter [Neomoorella glycerini]|uniref:Isoprimeverose transporter n=1 Tax=Neomoorella glycerini TaxID=55779 RepID=A0A6I5ZNK7_9FIRM|nr:MFS transporter [Moorella glycerini]QGP91151.1 Isoprimeverose transporter [Moorella glycerini]